MFADDTSIGYAANSIDTNKLSTRLRGKWLNTNKLSLNIAKTEFMIIGSRQRISAMDDRITVEINDCEVEKVDSVKSLGEYIDKHLNWSTHIEKISKKIASAIGALKRIRPYVTTDAAIQGPRKIDKWGGGGGGTYSYILVHRL